jgi:rhodanese-related sulfurtransferase
MNNSETIKNNVKTISTEELAAKLNGNERFEFWNVLTSEYYSNENIRGSRHVPLDQIGRELAGADLPKDTEIVVYCAGPECPQSGAAAEKLQAYGYANVRAYEGGLEEWEAAGLPIDADEASAGKSVPAAKNAGMSCH